MESLWLSFSLGLASAASPCLLPLYPSFLAYLTANTQNLEGRRGSGFLGLLILFGVLTTMLVVAIVLVAVAVPIGFVLGYAIPIVDALLDRAWAPAPRRTQSLRAVAGYRGTDRG